MSTQNTHFLVVAVAFCIILVIAAIFGMNYYIHQNQPGYYEYTISVHGLSDYRGGLVNEIVVPIPVIGGEQVFSDAKFQKEVSGNLTSVMVVSKYGKMLAFRSFGENLSNISAVFSRDLDRYPSEEEVEAGLLSPALSQQPDSNADKGASTYLILPDSLSPLSDDAGPISVRIRFYVYGDLSNGEYVGDYLAAIDEEIPPGTTGIVPVRIQTSYRENPGEAFRPIVWGTIPDEDDDIPLTGDVDLAVFARDEMNRSRIFQDELAGTVPGDAVFVHSLDEKRYDYWLIPYEKDGYIALIAQVSIKGDVADFSSAYAPLVKTQDVVRPTMDEAREVLSENGYNGSLSARLVWKPCEQTQSLVHPVWEFEQADGDLIYVGYNPFDEATQIYDELTEKTILG